MIFVKDSAVEEEKWERLLENSLQASPFQTLGTYNFFKGVENCSAHVFACEEMSEYTALAVVAVYKEGGIKGFLSKRAIIYGGPVFHNNNNQSIEAFLKYVNTSLKNEVIYTEIRNFFDYSQFKQQFTNAGWNFIDYLNVQIYLENKSHNEILAAMNSTRARQIRNTYKLGAVVGPSVEVNEITSFYKILKELYAQKVKLPIPDLNFFVNLIQSKNGIFFVVKHLDRVIGGAFCLWLPARGVYTFYYCGDDNYDKKMYPAHIAIDGAIKFAIENNLKVVDLMGAGKKDEYYGVRVYKERFGGLLVEHGRYLKISKPLLYKVGILGLKILKKLKR